MGIALDYKEVTPELVENTIRDVAENKKYLEAATKLSKISTDQPMTGLEKAVWWTEYVLRYNGAKHLRSPAVDMPLYEYFLLDVLAPIFAILLIVTYILLKLTKLGLRRVCRRCAKHNIKMFRLILSVILISVISATCDASKILFVASTPSHSHQVVFQPIWKELSLRGHQVTVITPSPLKDPKLTNLTEINVGYTYSLIEQKYKFSESLDTLKDEPLKFGKFFAQALSWINEDELSDPQVQRLIQDTDAEFDLVIVEFLLPTMIAFGHRFNCPVIAITSLIAFRILGHRFNCPVIAITSFDATLLGQDIMGNPTHPVLNPESSLKFNGNPTYFQKVYSVLLLNPESSLKFNGNPTYFQKVYSVLYSVLRRIGSFFIMKVEDQIVEKYFGPGYPPLSELTDNVAMFFMNVNPAFHNVRPTVPAVIHIGGNMNIKPPQKLPEDIQQYLDDAKDGAIYFSMGTNVRTKFIPQYFIETMLEAFSHLPYRILWKMDEIMPEYQSNNIHMVTWVSQQDVLRHPNVKAFITQGGLQSIEEAINLKTPLVCIPYFADQFSNCIQVENKVENKGMGIALDYKKMTPRLVQTAIVEVAENKKYLEAATKLSKISTDQPMTGLEKAVWWTEYVLRYNGAKHLRSPAVDMPLYEYFLLDVLALIFVTLLIVTYISLKLTKLVLRRVCRRFWTLLIVTYISLKLTKLVLRRVCRRFCCAKNAQKKEQGKVKKN
ncbi:UDP-glucoronosyl and UDP-glucosyl transferase [Popillia japonica]|uniref:UDP-glucoronosyl and UDP-glucosyl transferase n=1 Tax=Popillia japonica TaxID=7064 RepID=A0AAW1MJN0_POPJA